MTGGGEKQQQQQLARQQAEKMKDYKPEIKLSYTDKHGRELSTKEVTFFVFLKKSPMTNFSTH